MTHTNFSLNLKTFSPNVFFFKFTSLSNLSSERLISSLTVIQIWPPTPSLSPWISLYELCYLCLSFCLSVELSIPPFSDNSPSSYSSSSSLITFVLFPQPVAGNLVTRGGVGGRWVGKSAAGGLAVNIMNPTGKAVAAGGIFNTISLPGNAANTADKNHKDFSQTQR